MKSTEPSRFNAASATRRSGPAAILVRSPSELEVAVSDEATVSNQEKILANQDRILADLQRILSNQARLDEILANQQAILAKLGG